MVTFEDDSQIIRYAPSYNATAAKRSLKMQPKQARSQVTGWFPLSYKEGFDQWVYFLISVLRKLTTKSVRSGPI